MKNLDSYNEDAEGTIRLPDVQQALDAGELDAPTADEPRGSWKEDE